MPYRGVGKMFDKLLSSDAFGSRRVAYAVALIFVLLYFPSKFRSGRSGGKAASQGVVLSDVDGNTGIILSTCTCEMTQDSITHSMAKHTHTSLPNAIGCATLRRISHCYDNVTPTCDWTCSDMNTNINHLSFIFCIFIML